MMGNNAGIVRRFDDLASSIYEWLRLIEQPPGSGRFAFCKSGGFVVPGPRAGLGFSCLALKIAYTINVPHLFGDMELDQWIAFIRSFQAPSGKWKGYFEDVIILKSADRQAGIFRENFPVRRAETRQAIAALLAAGQVPFHPVGRLPSGKKQLLSFFRDLPWGKDPWAAGSQLGHLLFFSKVNADFFGHVEHFEETKRIILPELERLQDPETGSWFLGFPPVYQRINAAMKILTIYSFLKLPFGRPERLIDLCLSSLNDQDACHSVDVIYVLHECCRWVDYRRSEVERFAEERLSRIWQHAKPDGAFSFYPDRAGTTYYGASVSRGLPESDIHGTHLLTWAIALIADLLGLNGELKWRLPIT